MFVRAFCCCITISAELAETGRLKVVLFPMVPFSCKGRCLSLKLSTTCNLYLLGISSNKISFMRFSYFNANKLNSLSVISSSFSICPANNRNCCPNRRNKSHFSLAFMLLLRDIISTLIAFTTIFGILTSLASSLILLMIHIADDVSTSGILKANLIIDQ